MSEEAWRTLQHGVEIDELRKKLNDSRADVERLMAELHESKKSIICGVSYIGELKAEVERLKNDRNNYRESMIGCVKRAKELTKERDDARQSLKSLHAAINAADLDVSPCRKCGRPLVCLPDGLPMCKACAEKQS